MFLIVMTLFLRGERFDVVINDQVSAINPFLRVLAKKTIFYCHYPDAYLCTDRRNLVKRIYRIFFDLIERLTIGAADVVLVNSLYTRINFANFRWWSPCIGAVPREYHRTAQEIYFRFRTRKYEEAVLLVS